MSVAMPSLDELIEAHETSAADPDAPHSRRQIGALLSGAIAGAQTGIVHAGGVNLPYLAINADFFQAYA